MTPHILVIGSLNTDLITRTPKVPAGGETLTATSFSTGSGGKGANQAVACARASRPNPFSAIGNSDESCLANISMIGAVGGDVFGQTLLSELSSNGVNVDGVKVHTDEVSGIAVILVEESSGENRILITPGANSLVTVDGFEMLLSKTKPDLVVLQLEIPLTTVLAVMEQAKLHGIELLLNPAPAIELPERALCGLGHLVVNENEAGILAGLGSEVADEDLAKIFQRFERLGVHNTIVTLGSNGLCYSVGKGDFARLPARKVEEVVDTTAAGDTFVGTYAVEIVRNMAENKQFDIKAAVEKANGAAARTVEKAGAMKSIPWSDEV